MNPVRVLIIDDEPDICEALSLALSMEGYQVNSAGDRTSAIDLLASWQPSIIFLDYHIPDAKASEFVQQARVARPDVPIVLMTGKQDPAAHAAGLGVSMYLAKPFDLEDIIAVIRRHAS